MLSLNLLPQKEKEALKQERVQRWVGFYGLALLAIIFIFIFLLVIIWSYILIQLNSVSANLESAQNIFKNQGFREEESRIKEINLQLQKIDSAQKKQLYYSKVLAQLAMIIPADASLKSISINEQNKGSIFGFAAGRDQVILIKNELEKSEYFKNIESPLSNIVQQKDIDFSFSFDINLKLLEDD